MPPAGIELSEARRAAHELRAAVAAGDRAAIDRVLVAHPKYVGRPESRFRADNFRLRDAQAVIAREREYDSWRELCAAHDGGTARWREPETMVFDRAVSEAKEHGYDWLGEQHLVLALLRPPVRTVAQDVLEELGLRYDDAVARYGGPHRTRADDGIIPNPWFQKCVSFANALALADGVPTRDEHLLVALVYYDEGDALTSLDLDPDEVYEVLVERGVTVPSVRPRIAPTPFGPFGPRVYFPEAELDVVLDAFCNRDDLDNVHWGWNVSQWRPGQCWIDSEDEVDADAIVSGVLSNPWLAEAIPFFTAVREEMAAHEATLRRDD